jgi:hypothetical protein
MSTKRSKKNRGGSFGSVAVAGLGGAVIGSLATLSLACKNKSRPRSPSSRSQQTRINERERINRMRADSYRRKRARQIELDRRRTAQVAKLLPVAPGQK